MSPVLGSALWLLVGCVVVPWKLHRWGDLERLRWTDVPALVLVIALWPVLVVF